MDRFSNTETKSVTCVSYLHSTVTHPPPRNDVNEEGLVLASREFMVGKG